MPKYYVNKEDSNQTTGSKIFQFIFLLNAVVFVIISILMLTMIYTKVDAINALLRNESTIAENGRIAKENVQRLNEENGFLKLKLKIAEKDKALALQNQEIVAKKGELEKIQSENLELKEKLANFEEKEKRIRCHQINDMDECVKVQNCIGICHISDPPQCQCKHRFDYK